MVGETGFEPKKEVASSFLEVVGYDFGGAPCPHIGPQTSGAHCPEMEKIQRCWNKLPKHLRDAIEAICEPYC